MKLEIPRLGHTNHVDILQKRNEEESPAFYYVMKKQKNARKKKKSATIKEITAIDAANVGWYNVAWSWCLS